MSRSSTITEKFVCQQSDWHAVLFLCMILWFATPAESIELQAFGCPSRDLWGGTNQPSWSPSGEYIAYIWDNVPSPYNIPTYVLRAANFNCESPTWLPGAFEYPISSIYGITSPTWSPDGRRIAFGRPYDEDPTRPEGIWILGESSSPVFLLSRPNVGSCAWSPLGDAIAFVEEGSLELVTVETRSVRHLRTDIDSKPSWSPDGRSLVYSSQGDLWVIDVATSAVRQLTFDPAMERNPAWSPNGRWIAYSSNRGGHCDLWVMPAAGVGAIQLTADEPCDDQPSWSPSGDRIAFWSSRDHSSSLWQGGIWIASQLPDVLTEVVPRSWSAVKSSFR